MVRLLGKRWFHGYISRLLLLSVVTLSVFAVWLSFYLDKNANSWIDRHPLTANLIASGLSLPAAFLIVNLAAERAVRWADESRWQKVRETDISAFEGMWELCRFLFVERFSILDDSESRLVPARDAIEQTEQIISGALKASKHPDPVRIPPLEWRAQVIVGAVESLDDFADEATHREKLEKIFIPRLQTLNQEPTVVGLIRTVEDNLSLLNDALTAFENRMKHTPACPPDHDLFTGGATETTTYPTRAAAAFPLHRLRALRSVLTAGENFLRSMDALEDSLTGK